MPYATLADLITAFSEDEILQLSNIDDPDAIAIGRSVVDRALQDASDQIDAYLSARYSVPLNPVPSLIKNYTCDVTRYLLDKDNPREEVTRRRDLVFAFLRDLSMGKANLPGITTSDSTLVSDVPIYSSPARVWTTETLKDY